MDENVISLQFLCFCLCVCVRVIVVIRFPYVRRHPRLREIGGGAGFVRRGCMCGISCGHPRVTSPTHYARGGCLCVRVLCMYMCTERLARAHAAKGMLILLLLLLLSAQSSFVHSLVVICV